MKIIKIRLVKSGLVRELSAGGIEYSLGDPAGPNWGGGTIKEFTVDRSLDSVMVRKTTRYIVPHASNDGSQTEFDLMAIPMHEIAAFYCVEDAPNGQNKPAKV